LKRVVSPPSPAPSIPLFSQTFWIRMRVCGGTRQPLPLHTGPCAHDKLNKAARSPLPHGPAEGTQKVWTGSPEGKLFQKFPLWPPEASKKRPGFP
jgi:hypothetical protein